MSETGAIVALDLASATGWCIGAPREVPRLGTVQLAPRGGIGQRGCALVDFLADQCALLTPALLVFEAPLPHHSSIQAGRIALGLAMAAEMFCWRRNVPCREANLNTVRKLVLGRGNATKDDAMAACRNAGLKPPTHDAADAWALWRFAVLTRGVAWHGVAA